MPQLDYNYNYNYNYSAGGQGGGGGLRTRPRFNTDIFALLIDTTQMVVPAPNAPGAGAAVAPTYPPYFPTNWDADLRACMYLDWFTTATPGWRARYGALLTTAPFRTPQSMTQAALQDQAVGILQLALERDDRFDEVIDQDDGEGAINYTLGMLKIDPARYSATNLMVRIGRRIGEHVVMCLKGDFMSPRPPQLCPAITPMIDPPLTPSYPAGHAVQSYLIAYLLGYCLQNLPQHNFPAAPTYANQASGSLFDLAARISQNRIVAGVHYPIDIEAGIAVAIALFNDLQNVSQIWDAVTGLRPQVQKEFPQYV
jgi:membrane-associated phospholipid phosphatase